MSDIVDGVEILKIVGAYRHETQHIARAVSEEQKVYILHSATCVDSDSDLRECMYSKALDNGIDPSDWSDCEDRPMVVIVNRRGGGGLNRLVPVRGVRVRVPEGVLHDLWFLHGDATGMILDEQAEEKVVCFGRDEYATPFKDLKS